MDAAAAQWTTHQGIGVVKDVEISSSGTRALQLQGDHNKRVIRPSNYKEQSLNCPRCNSSNTKFCYYNNYSLSQPRYFCKTCRRYWTEGGSLRNVPVGGGSRKNKKPSSSSSSPAAAATAALPVSSSLNLINTSDLIPIPSSIPLPSSKFYQDQGGQDLNLSFASQNNLAHYAFVPPSPGLGAGYGFQELMRQSNMKLLLGDSNGGYSTMQEAGPGGGRLLFPFEDLRQVEMSSNGGRGNGAQNGVIPEGEGHDPSLFW